MSSRIEIMEMASPQTPETPVTSLTRGARKRPSFEVSGSTPPTVSSDYPEGILDFQHTRGRQRERVPRGGL